jgi:phosphoribosylanthranilate isomerase
MRVKICGITNLRDAMGAVECGADALGFVFYPNSPRYITPQNARKIIDALPPFVESVGLFVNEGLETIDTIAKYSAISRVQVHFEVDEESLDAIARPTLPVVRAKQKEDIARFGSRYRLVDAFCESYGGSGKSIDLSWFDGVDCSKIILAGGLTAENLVQLKGRGFYGVDVSSGVELVKGKKDLAKVEQFIKNAKSL